MENLNLVIHCLGYVIAVLLPLFIVGAWEPNILVLRMVQ